MVLTGIIMKGSRPIWGLDTMSVYPAVISVRAAAPNKMSMTDPACRIVHKPRRWVIVVDSCCKRSK